MIWSENICRESRSKAPEILKMQMSYLNNVPLRFKNEKKITYIFKQLN